MFAFPNIRIFFDIRIRNKIFNANINVIKFSVKCNHEIMVIFGDHQHFGGNRDFGFTVRNKVLKVHRHRSHQHAGVKSDFGLKSKLQYLYFIFLKIGNFIVFFRNRHFQDNVIVRLTFYTISYNTHFLP